MLMLCSGISASLLSGIKDCQTAAAISLIPIIIGLSSAGMALIGKRPAAVFTVSCNTVTFSTAAFFIYRLVKKRRKAAARVAVDPALPPGSYQPDPFNPAWQHPPPYVAGGYGAPSFSSPPGMVLAKYPPFYTAAHHNAGIKKPAQGYQPAVYSTAPAMPGLVPHFYDGTAPPLAPTPPPSARQSPKPPAASSSPTAPQKPVGRRK
jgi:hypothetical protein